MCAQFCGWLREEWAHTNLGLHLGIVHDGYDEAVSFHESQTCAKPSCYAGYTGTKCGSRTILHLANTGLEVIQGHVADLVFEAREIHGEGRSQ